MVEIPTRFRAPGARRRSHYINRKPASNFWHAFNHATNTGRSFNLHVTLNFAHTDCPADRMTEGFCRLLDEKFGPWWRRPSRHLRLGPQGSPVYAWVAENVSDQPNMHWAVFIPPERRVDFQMRLPKWLETITGGQIGVAAIKVEAIYNPPGLRRYMLKGCDDVFARLAKIAQKPQGLVIGKRSGVSRSLQRTARERASYRPGRRVAFEITAPSWR